MDIKVFCTGGTFDKLYYDALSEYSIGEPQITSILEQANVTFTYEVESILKKDSLDITHEDREHIAAKVAGEECSHILIVHGTDTMTETARALWNITEKTIVLVGAMRPALFRDSDATFNSGFALAAVRLLPPGIYIAMNGQVFTADSVQKNRQQGRFEPR
jgi:L-asparaginase